jgi:hypothetical protein
MPPLGQYFSRLQKKADESIAAPKGRESRTPSLFPCKRATSWGAATVAMMAIADPLVGTLFAASVAVVVGEGHAPVAAVLVPAVKTRARI